MAVHTHTPTPVPAPVPAPPFVAEAERERPIAQWGARVAARLIDWVIVLVPAAIVALVIALVWIGGQALDGLRDGSVAWRNFVIIFSVVYFLILTVYDTVLVKGRRRTFGKSLLKLEVAPADNGGRPGPIPVASIIARSAVLNIGSLTMALGWAAVVFIGPFAVLAVVIWPLWDRPNHQGAHDKVARTVVVRAN
ncbi:RDD family protein [Nocardiopsis mangrovi]|uniref:RDD family protein n=1 Tax=Nocardiopsis mangrovi TaxID=1179818 RepID=A0ABV9E5A7_9ACTN